MFEGLDAILLARIQFAFTVSFHFIFPAFTIGLASYLAVLNGLFLYTKQHKYLDLYRYWVKIFALAFAMGVVSGIVMSYQFGTNWSVFSDKAGPVIGGPMSYEVLSAFFLEAGFLGIMLFGRERVGPVLHMGATLAVALGTFMSAFWILSVNSWMHTPAGFIIDEVSGQFLPTNFWEVIFNPSFPYRLTHTLAAAYLTTAFIVGGVAAFHLLRRKRRGEQPSEATKTMFSMAMWMAAIMTPIQIGLGHEHGLNTYEYQPAKFMAMEGYYNSYPDGAPYYIFGIPNDETQTLDYAVGIPKLGSIVLKGDPNYPGVGLDTIADDEQPPVFLVFWSFRVMVGIGLLMLGVGMWSLWSRYRGTLFENKWLHRAALTMGPSGLVAVLAGWITTEVGRQPYTVYGFLRTYDSAAPLEAPAVAASLIVFIVVYFAVFGAGTFYILRMMSKPPVFGEKPLKDDIDGPIRTAGTTPAAEVMAQKPGRGGQTPKSAPEPAE